MKAIFIFAVILCVHKVQANWLNDWFTGLSEAFEDSKVKDLETKVKKITSDVVKTFKTNSDLPNNDWIKVTKKYLEDITFKDILKEGDDKMEDIVERWNSLLAELNNPEKFGNTTDLYKKVSKDLKDLLPKELFKKWKSKVHNVASMMKKNMSKIKEINVETLKKHIKAWVEPTFMQHKEDLEEEKQMVKDALEAANKQLEKGVVGFKKTAQHVKDHVKETAVQIKEKMTDKVTPIFELGQAKRAEAEKTVQKWLEKTFTKPHHPSRWTGKVHLKKLQKQFPGIPLKKIKKLFKKMQKKNKSLLIVKQPIETNVTKIPIFTDEEKKLEKLTPAEQEEYKEAEAAWEKKMLMEAIAVSKKLALERETVKRPENKKLAGKENWDLLAKYEDQEDDEGDDEYEEKSIFNFQRTKPKLTKDFAAKLAKEESQWYDLRKKLKNMS